jgi:hypothetical protein
MFSVFMTTIRGGEGIAVGEVVIPKEETEQLRNCLGE